MFYKKLSIGNKIAFWTLIISIVSILIGLFGKKEIQGIDIQETKGDKSPIINTEENVNINY